MIKPDAVKAGAAEAIIKEVEAAGFTVLGKVEKTLTEDDAKTFYAEHVGKGFFPNLLGFMTSGPTVALALERMDAIRSWRMMMGPTSTADAKDKAPASIRARFGTDHTMNASHGSDSTESAARELGFWYVTLGGGWGVGDVAGGLECLQWPATRDQLLAPLSPQLTSPGTHTQVSQPIPRPAHACPGQARAERARGGRDQVHDRRERVYHPGRGAPPAHARARGIVLRRAQGTPVLQLARLLHDVWTHRRHGSCQARSDQGVEEPPWPDKVQRQQEGSGNDQEQVCEERHGERLPWFRLAGLGGARASVLLSRPQASRALVLWLARRRRRGR